MEKITYTQGPWKIGYGGDEGDGYATIVSPYRNRAIAQLTAYEDDGITDAEMRANARLIILAPELLEVCQGIATLVNDNGKMNLPEVAGKAKQLLEKIFIRKQTRW